MPRREIYTVEANGEVFRFFYDRRHPDVLHITFQHRTTEEDAIAVFFSGYRHVWDEARRRFETSTDTHTLYWTRYAFDQSVLIISCFPRGDE